MKRTLTVGLALLALALLAVALLLATSPTAG